MDLQTWIPSCHDKTSWPDGWWHSRNFIDHVIYGDIAEFVIRGETGTRNDNVNAMHVAKYLTDQGFSGSKGFTKRLHKQNITSFVGAMELLMKKYTDTSEKVYWIMHGHNSMYGDPASEGSEARLFGGPSLN